MSTCLKLIWPTSQTCGAWNESWQRIYKDKNGNAMGYLLLNEMDYRKRIIEGKDEQSVTSNFPPDISRWGKIPLMAWERKDISKRVLNCLKFIRYCCYCFDLLIVCLLQLLLTCTTREVAALLWTLSRRRAFWGPANILFIKGKNFWAPEIKVVLGKFFHFGAMPKYFAATQQTPGWIHPREKKLLLRGALTRTQSVL